MSPQGLQAQALLQKMQTARDPRLLKHYKSQAVKYAVSGGLIEPERKYLMPQFAQFGV
jgi:hypothetical protein